jgi:predicted transcriptional regulator
MEPTECSSGGPVLGDDVVRRSVRDVMLSRPKTLPADATVADLRRLFANPRVETAVLVDRSRFVGVIDREGVDEVLPDDVPARSLARGDGVTIGADATVADAMARLDANRASRLVVVGDDGVTLQGLLCLNTRRTGFCA